jgi:chromosome segregation ATPase
VRRITSDEYRELSARVDSLETQMGSMRARHAGQRGELAVLNDAVQDVRQVQREHTEILIVLTDLARQHSQKLDAHSVTLDAHSVRLDEHSTALAELKGMVGQVILRLDER